MIEIKKAIKDIFFNSLSPKLIADYNSLRLLGRRINWKYPKDFNDKINWLKIYSDTSLWTEYSDKLLVRKHISDLGLSNLLVPLLGHWNNAKEIDFDSLPNQFVLKTNHGSGEVIVVRDKNAVNKEEIIKKIQDYLNTPYGLYQAEPHYLKIKPCILAEAFLEQNSPLSTSVIDYKIFCFDGKPYSTLCFFNRTKTHYDFELHDLDWYYHPEYLVFNNHSRDGKGVIPKPKTYNQMLKAAAILSKGFPQVRVDFYEIDGKLYFSELTFTSTGGFIRYLSSDYLKQLGDQVILPYN